MGIRLVNIFFRFDFDFLNEWWNLILKKFKSPRDVVPYSSCDGTDIGCEVLCEGVRNEVGYIDAHASKTCERKNVSTIRELFQTFIHVISTEVGIYKRKQESKKTRKQELD